MLVGRPFASSRLVKYLSKRILQLRPKTQAQIATEAGFVSVNMLSIIKAGSTRLPLDRVPALAKALECDPAYLLLLTLEQMMGSTEARALLEIMTTLVTKNEMEWVAAIREASDLSDPPLTKRGRAAILGIFGK